MTCVSSTPSCDLEAPALSRDRCSSAADKLVYSSHNADQLQVVIHAAPSASEPIYFMLEFQGLSAAPGRAGSAVVRIDALRFLVGCRTRRLNQDLSILSLSLDFFECVCCAVNNVPLLRCVNLFYLCVLSLGYSCSVVTACYRYITRMLTGYIGVE